MKRRFYDSSYGHPSVAGHAVFESKDADRRLTGVAATPHGYVRVVGMSCGFIDGEEWGPCTRLWFIWKGRHYDRTYRGVLSSLGATRCAGRFAREIAGKKR